ncbi:heat-inducible transcription repressor HrcA [Geotalea daltonii FRC-32]|uniref:Heat-inducible transcription repressor HrcA n=1 Tax=Geotalea daltonii (strain DSM 22248 / JCM 15807 / FRC-32) TaxID=316067 RepID=B9M355_GEODF|nr:heat-inducible transcriptional repressor HrcA [Geotalea daltonii]ACM19465.1 heat-inducible transcription repressor HrcA [Geotalea daltonii FRC-32]
MDEQLSPRGRQILEAIIEDYIVTAEPVGSRTITRRHPMALSPATVRNVMADLEEMGFLASPHTSAGRIPTDKAYRFYVNSLLSVRNIGRDEQEEILRRCSVTGKDMAEVLKETSRMLSSTSHYMGIVVAPRFDANVFRQIEFVKLGSRRLLAILVSQNGTVQNRIIEADEDIPADDLVKMSNYLNDLLEGLTIAQVRSKLLQEMQSDKAKYDRFMARALSLSTKTVDEDVAEVFIEGQVNIFDQPEFADVAKMKEIFRTFEKKSTILQLFDRAIAAEGVQIYIGAESHLSDMPGMSLITSTYVTGQNTLGVLGVVGPTRMGYAKVIPIVDYTAKLVSRLLEME